MRAQCNFPQMAPCSRPAESRNHRMRHTPTGCGRAPQTRLHLQLNNSRAVRAAPRGGPTRRLHRSTMGHYSVQQQSHSPAPKEAVRTWAPPAAAGPKAAQLERRGARYLPAPGALARRPGGEQEGQQPRRSDPLGMSKLNVSSPSAGTGSRIFAGTGQARQCTGHSRVFR